MPPTNKELIDEARSISGATVIGTTRWLPSEHIHLLADALEKEAGLLPRKLVEIKEVRWKDQRLSDLVIRINSTDNKVTIDTSHTFFLTTDMINEIRDVLLEAVVLVT